MPKLLNSVSTLYTNLPFWTRLPVPPTQPQFSSVFSLRSFIHPSTPIVFSGFPGNWSWMVTRTFSLSRSQQQQDIMPDTFMLSWLEMDWPFQSWTLSCYVIHVQESPIYTIFGVITVFPKLTKTNLFPEADAMPDKPNIKTLVPTSNESILKQKKTRAIHLAIFLEPFVLKTIPCSFHRSIFNLRPGTPKGHRTLEFYKTFLQDLAFAYREQQSPTVVSLATSCNIQWPWLACLQKPSQGQSEHLKNPGCCEGGATPWPFKRSTSEVERPQVETRQMPRQTNLKDVVRIFGFRDTFTFKEKQPDLPDFLLVGLVVLYACNVQGFIHTTDSHLPANAQASISALTQSPCEASSWLYMNPVNQW